MYDNIYSNEALLTAKATAAFTLDKHIFICLSNAVP